MPEAGSAQKFGTTKRLDDVAATTESATSVAVTPLRPALLAVDASRPRWDNPATGRIAGRVKDAIFASWAWISRRRRGPGRSPGR